MPKISIIIPVYGVEKYIEQCARSLFEQTLDDIEYLFINDCTHDKSVDILKRVLSEYPVRLNQVRIIDMPQNSGQAAVRVKGIQEATGEYIIHCDSDDWAATEMYEALYEKAVKTNADCVICNYFTNTRDCNTTQTVKKVGNLLDAFFDGVIKGTLWNKLYKRSLLKIEELVPPEGNMGEDLFINMQYAINVSKVAYVGEHLYYYRIVDSSICNSQSKESAVRKFKESIKNVQPMERWMKANSLDANYLIQFMRIQSSKRDWLIPYINNSECYHLWRDTFPNLNRKLLCSRRVSFWTKMKLILGCLRIPYLKLKQF